MELTKENIIFVKRFEREDTTYNYFVMLQDKEGTLDSRSYCNYDNGIKTTNLYDFTRLPKCVQEFVNEKLESKCWFKYVEWHKENDGLKHKYAIQTFE